MVPVMMISFREGLEAFLIIAIALIYLGKTNRRHLVPAVYSGVALALLVSVILGLLLAQLGALSPFWEGVLALVAAASVIYCTVHMMRMGRFMKREITGGLERADQQGSGFLLVFLFSAFMVGREGVETATMIASLASQAEDLQMALGGLIGVVLAALLAGAWVRFGQRVNLTRFFQLTAVFMVAFAIQLVIAAFHEFTESGSIPGLDNAYWHIVTEPWGPEGDIGLWFSFALGLLPLGWMMYAWRADRKSHATTPASHGA